METTQAYSPIATMAQFTEFMEVGVMAGLMHPAMQPAISCAITPEMRVAIDEKVAEFGRPVPGLRTFDLFGLNLVIYRPVQPEDGNFQEPTDGDVDLVWVLLAQVTAVMAKAEYAFPFGITAEAAKMSEDDVEALNEFHKALGDGVSATIIAGAAVFSR